MDGQTWYNIISGYLLIGLFTLVSGARVLIQSIYLGRKDAYPHLTFLAVVTWPIVLYVIVRNEIIAIGVKRRLNRMKMEDKTDEEIEEEIERIKRKHKLGKYREGTIHK